MDWTDIGRRYDESTLDRERLDTYARKVAHHLQSANTKFDGVFSAYEGYYAAKSIQLRNGILRRFFGAGPVRQETIRKGLGYWKLNQNHWGTLDSSRSHSHRDYWILLEDGRLGRYRTNNPHDGTTTVSCDGEPMSDDDVLLLDRKHIIIEEGKDFFEGREKYSRLTVSRKGAGCSRLLTKLLKERHLTLPTEARGLAIETNKDAQIEEVANAIMENIFNGS